MSGTRKSDEEIAKEAADNISFIGLIDSDVKFRRAITIILSALREARQSPLVDNYIRWFVNDILHGDSEHRAWLLEAAEAFIDGKPMPPPRAKSPAPKCSHCSKPATCFGSYESDHNWGFACDECCGHGNEDGQCFPLTEFYENLPTLFNSQSGEARQHSAVSSDTLTPQGKATSGIQAKLLRRIVKFVEKKQWYSGDVGDFEDLEATSLLKDLRGLSPESANTNASVRKQ